MIRHAILAATLALAAPAFAQPSAGQVDAAAILDFDPAGAAGLPLTPQRVRDFLAASIAAPSPAEDRAAGERARLAKVAMDEALAADDIYLPHWQERTIELDTGAIRPMTAAEATAVDEYEAAQASRRTLSAQATLARASQSERIAYAKALSALLDAGVRFTGSEMDGYRKIDADWIRFGGWEERAGDRMPVVLPIPLETENALLRYELARLGMESGIRIRTQGPFMIFNNAVFAPK